MDAGVQYFRSLSDYDLESWIGVTVERYNGAVRRKQEIRAYLQRVSSGLDEHTVRKRRSLISEEVVVNDTIVFLRSNLKMARKEREARLRRAFKV